MPPSLTCPPRGQIESSFQPWFDLHGKTVCGTERHGDRVLWIEFTDGTALRVEHAVAGLVIRTENSPMAEIRGDA